jgi:hypothetical protein
MNAEFRQLFAALYRLASPQERRNVIRWWSLAKMAHKAPDRDLDRTADTLLGMRTPAAPFSRSAYVTALCVVAQERKVRRVLRSCMA